MIVVSWTLQSLNPQGKETYGGFYLFVTTAGTETLNGTIVDLTCCKGGETKVTPKTGSFNQNSRNITL